MNLLGTYRPLDDEEITALRKRAWLRLGKRNVDHPLHVHGVALTPPGSKQPIRLAWINDFTNPQDASGTLLAYAHYPDPYGLEPRARKQLAKLLEYDTNGLEGFLERLEPYARPEGEDLTA